MFRQFQINRQNSILAYKILHDSLLVLLIFFVLALIAEGLLPEIIATHFALYKIALLILGNVLAITGLQKVTSIHEENKINKKIAGSLFFILALLIFNSLFKLNIFLNLFILIFIFITVYFIFKVFQEKV
ncbi:MAG: hypothetical protein COX30_03965 [Candidatus Moranbacteria bacterium CG23_combo_of_CG06-09_8_20_14_all_39_10]|nr:MAG: hypothetical protein COX30_03965 [Candidatus Moranbacteria bacterium CG23_combo_of_CG06-09_8_20_14_all_39_10]